MTLVLSESTLNPKTPEKIVALLDAGADGSPTNEMGETPFDLAKNNETLNGTDSYWKLNDARFNGERSGCTTT